MMTMGEGTWPQVMSSAARLTQGHFIRRAPQQRNCALCYHSHPAKAGEKQVRFWCAWCKLHLHIECFEEFHTKKHPVSPFTLAISATANPVARPAVSSATSSAAPEPAPAAAQGGQPAPTAGLSPRTAPSAQPPPAAATCSG